MDDSEEKQPMTPKASWARSSSYRRRYIPRRRSSRYYKPKKVSKTKAAVVPYAPKIANAVHTFQESFLLQNVTTATGQALGYTFSISNVTDYVNYLALFEEFRLDRVTITATSYQTEANVAVGSYMPTLYVAVDPTDGTAPASLDAILQTGRWKMYQLHKPQVIADFVPTIPIETSASAGVTTTSYRPNTWVRNENVAIQHNGLKIWMDQALPASGTISLVATYTISFRFGL